MDSRKLRNALRTAFNESSLRILVRSAFDVDLAEIAQGDNYRETVFELVEWARRSGKLKMLLHEAVIENPDNPLLQELTRATFIDDVPEFVEWDGPNVANDFFNQILLLNQALSELRGEVQALRHDMNMLKSERGLPVHDRSVSLRMELLMIALIVVMVLIGLQLRGVI